MGSGRPFSEGWVEYELQDHAESLAVFHCPHIYTKKNLQDLSMASVSIPPSVLLGLSTELRKDAGSDIEPRQ